jgi:hypothetical protein
MLSLLGSYHIATVPKLNSSQLPRFKSTYFDSPASNPGGPKAGQPGAYRELVFIDQSQLGRCQRELSAPTIGSQP